jgi:hypothetical protein
VACVEREALHQRTEMQAESAVSTTLRGSVKDEKRKENKDKGEAGMKKG